MFELWQRNKRREEKIMPVDEWTNKKCKRLAWWKSSVKWSAWKKATLITSKTLQNCISEYLTMKMIKQCSRPDFVLNVLHMSILRTSYISYVCFSHQLNLLCKEESREWAASGFTWFRWRNEQFDSLLGLVWCVKNFLRFLILIVIHSWMLKDKFEVIALHFVSLLDVNSVSLFRSSANWSSFN